LVKKNKDILIVRFRIDKEDNKNKCMIYIIRDLVKEKLEIRRRIKNGNYHLN
jgi:hypothetical protein